MTSEYTAADYKTNQLPFHLLQKMHDEKVFLGFVPTEFGGLQWSLAQGLKVIHDYSKKFGSAGWCVNLGAGAGYFSGFFPTEAAREIFSTPQAALAGSGKVGGTCKNENGFITLSGEWDKCTGSAHATHFTVNAIDENDDLASYVVAATEVKIHEEWDVFAFRPTSSFGIAGENIPSICSFKIGEIANPYAYEIHRLGFMPFARFCMGIAFAGLGRSLLESAQINEASEKLKTHLEDWEFRIFREADKVWDRLLKGDFVDDIPQLQTIIRDGSLKIFRLTNEIYHQGGMRMSDENQIVHWKFREILAASQHFMLK